MEKYESTSNWFKLKDDGDVSLLLKQISLANEFVSKLRDDLDKVEFIVNGSLRSKEELFISLEPLFKNNKLLFRCMDEINFHNFFKKHLHPETNLISKVFDREKFEIIEEIICSEK